MVRLGEKLTPSKPVYGPVRPPTKEAGRMTIRPGEKGAPGAIVVPRGTTPSQAIEMSRTISGRGGGGGGRAINPAIAAAERVRLAAIEREKITKAAEERRIAAAKSFAEKTRIARKIVETRRVNLEFKKILNYRANLVRRGVQERTVLSRDVKTGDKLQVTQWRARDGSRVQRIVNRNEGTTSYSSFARPRAGGSVRQTGGVVMGTTPTITAKELKITAALRLVEKELPSGVSFQRDKFGNILNIDDKNRGINVELNALSNYINPEILVKLGLATRVKEAPAEKVPSLVKRIVSAWSPKKYRKYREEQRKDYYDFFNLKGKDRNFWTLQNTLLKARLNSTQQAKFNKLAEKKFREDLLNPDTKIRAETALIIAAIAGGPLIGGIVGAAFKTPIALAEDLGVEETLKDTTWKEVAKKGGVEFGKNAIQAYVALKLFGLGTKVAAKVPVLAGLGLTTLGLKRTGILTDKVLKIALRKGLNIVGAQYLSSVGVDVAKLGKKVKEKKYKAATVKASGLLGTLVGFYGEKAVRSTLRKVLLQEDPRLILTKGTRAKPFAIEHRGITLARLNQAKKLLKGKKPMIPFAKASPVKEPRKAKIVTPEKRVARGVKIEVPTPSGYATYAVGEKIYVIPSTFLKRRPGNLPKTYYTKWFQSVKKKGLLPTFKELGIPRIYSPTIYKGSGEYLSRKRGESLKDYYARGQRVANKLNVVQVVAAPKTVLGAKQPELEIKTIYPNPKGIKADVTRVKVGKDGFGHDIVVEIVAPKSIVQRIKFMITEKIKFKIEALKYLTNREAKIARDLSDRIIQNYDFIYKSKVQGSAAARKHMLKVESNFRRILKQYGIKATNAEIKAVSRLHDILKLRGINVKDEPIIRKAILEGYLNKIPLIKNLTFKQRRRVADAIGYHQDVNPGTLKALKLDKFTKAFINADRLDITRYGIKVNPKKLFNLKSKSIIPKNIRKEFARLNKLKIKKTGFTAILRNRYNSLVKRYPGLKGKKFEDRMIAENKLKYKQMSSKGKSKIKKQEREYKDYKESLSEYKKSRKGKKVKLPPYRTKKYESYKTPKLKAAYRNGYNAGERVGRYAPKNYKTNYGRYQSAYASGYRDSYKGNYKISYKTGKYSYKGRVPTPTPTKKPPIIFTAPKGFKKRKLTKKTPVYMVKARKRGKMVNLAAKPLVKADALNYLAYRLDTELLRTAFLVPIGSSRDVLRLPSKMVGYFTKNKKKLRGFRTIQGKKKILAFGFIEKKKFIGDVASEISELQKARLRAKAIAKLKRGKIVRRKVINRKKKINKSRRKPILKRKIIKRKVIKNRRLSKSKIKIKRRRVKSKNKKIVNKKKIIKSKRNKKRTKK